MLTFVTFARLKPGSCASAARMATLTSPVSPSAGTAGAAGAAVTVAAFGGRECRRLAAETKGDRTPMVSCPLLTPLTFLRDAQRSFASKRGLRGLGSGRFSAYVWL